MSVKWVLITVLRHVTTLKEDISAPVEMDTSLTIVITELVLVCLISIHMETVDTPEDLL